MAIEHQQVGYFWQISFTALLGTVLAPFVSVSQAQVIPDATLGTERSQVRQETIRSVDSDRISGGARRGDNLFHSFTQFDVNAGRGAYFDHPPGVENIFGRVTGHDRSEILGRVGVLQIGTADRQGSANLFLINPNGILFGRGADLDLGGSFTATTATAIQFGDQGRFDGANPDPPGLLTVQPSAYLFSSIPAPISVSRTNLEVAPQQSLSLLGGNILLEGDRPQNLRSLDSSSAESNGGRLKAPNGRVEIGGMAQLGRVGLDINHRLSFPEAITLANVTLRNGAFIEVADRGSGEVSIHARRLELFGGSVILAGVLPGMTHRSTGTVGNILINTTDLVRLRDSRIQNLVPLGGSGRTGDIRITTGSLLMNLESQLNTSLEGAGRVGQVNINARLVSLNRSSQIFSNITSEQGLSSGGIRIYAESVLIDGESRLESGTITGNGQPGSICIVADRSVLINGGSKVGASIFSEESGNDENTPNSNTGGRIVIRSDLLRITGAEVNASTSGASDAGRVSIYAEDIVMSSGGAMRGGVNASGNGASIRIVADSLQMVENSEIEANSFSIGNAGTISIILRNRLEGEDSNIQTTARSASGGEIQITAANIQLSGRSVISTEVENGQNNGGDITLTADRILALDDVDFTSSAGNAGDIRLETAAFLGENYQAGAPSNERDQVNIDAAGTVEDGVVATPDTTFIQNSLAQLPDNNLPIDNILANSCIALQPLEEGRFVVTGAGGLPESPGNVASSSFPTGEVRSLPFPSRPWQIGDPIIEPQGVYQLPEGRLILARVCQ